MTPEEFKNLKRGDVVANFLGISYVVTANYGDYVIGVRTAHITNPDEWALLRSTTDDLDIMRKKGK